MALDLARLDRQLQQAFARGATDTSGGDLQAFWLAWEQDGGQRLADMAAFQAAMAEAGGPLEVLDRIHGVLQDAAGKLASRLTGEAKVFVKALLLATIAHHAAAKGLSGVQAQDNRLTVRVQDPVTAYVLAAVHTGSGLRLAPGPSPNRPVALNVLQDDTPALEFGSEDAACDAWGAELLAWADAVLASPEDWLTEFSARPRRASTPAVNPDTVNRALDRVERRMQMRPMVVSRRSADNALAGNTGLQAAVSSLYGGIPAVLHDDTEQVALEAQHLESDIQRFVVGSFAALEAALPPSSAQGTRRRVFVSYAHADGEAWREHITRHLQSLVDSDAVQPWSDTAIEAGDDWYRQIEQALASSACAVLVLTSGFLASPFIRREEIPALLKRHAALGMPVLPILASDCAWQGHNWLQSMQIQCKEKPLDQLCEGRADGPAASALAQLAQRVQRELSKHS